MRRSGFESRAIVAGLIRRRPAIKRRWPAVRFSLRSYLLGTGAFSLLLWFVQLAVRSPRVDLPLPVHLWFFALWASLIIGAVATGGLWWPATLGVLGIGATAIGLLVVYVKEIDGPPLLTIWSTLLVFATFAHLGSGVFSFQQERYALAAVNVSSFLISVVVMIFLCMR